MLVMKKSSRQGKSSLSVAKRIENRPGPLYLPGDKWSVTEMHKSKRAAFKAEESQWEQPMALMGRSKFSVF